MHPRMGAGSRGRQEPLVGRTIEGEAYLSGNSPSDLHGLASAPSGLILVSGARSATHCQECSMIDRRPFNTLGGANHGWLNAKHHFSFAN